MSHGKPAKILTYQPFEMEQLPEYSISIPKQPSIGGKIPFILGGIGLASLIVGGSIYGIYKATHKEEHK